MTRKLLLLPVCICMAASMFVAVSAFQQSSFILQTLPPTSSSRLSIGKVFGGDKTSEEQLPKDVKDAISKCRGAVQKALENRLSRMDVEMPVGANFGVEKKKASSSKRKSSLSSLTDGDSLTDGEEGLTMEKLDTSNRELARLFVEMFQPLGGQHISAVFNDENLANEARSLWSGDLSVECNIVAIDRKGKRSRGGLLGGGKKKKKAVGFASKMAAEMEDDGSSGPFVLPKDTEVALFVSPGPKELIAIERICNEVGMGTCVILLNARLSRVEKYASDEARKLFEGFEKVWFLGAAPQEKAPGCLMHRAYPGKWLLARKPKIGAPKTIASKEDMFNGDECEEAYSKIEVSDLEKTTENLAMNMAGWFK
ncbi:hypothetical protein ACHAXM_008140 [Skeletonema potamos]